MRRERQAERGPGFVPAPVMVSGRYLELVIPRPQIREVGDPPISRFDPRRPFTRALQPIAESHPFRRGEAIGGIANLQHPRAAWRQLQDSRDRKSTRLNSSHLGISY